MIATITAGVTDMSGCRHGRKKKKKSLRYQGRTAKLLLIYTCTELTFTVSVIRFWKFNYVVKTCFRKAEAVARRGGSLAQIGQDGTPFPTRSLVAVPGNQFPCGAVLIKVFFPAENRSPLQNIQN